MEAACDAFVEHLRAEVRASPNTVRAYARDIAAFVASTGARLRRAPTPADLTALTRLSEDDCDDIATIEGRMAVVTTDVVCGE